MIICSWITQTDPDSAKIVEESTNIVANSAKLLVFGAILSNTVFWLFVRGIQNSKEDIKSLLRMLACCGVNESCMINVLYGSLKN